MKRTLSCLLLLAMLLSVLSFSTPGEALAAGNQPSQYSDTANSGTRDVVCTTLSGTGAAAYYTGSYTYANLSGQSESALLQSLRKLMTETHEEDSSYSDCRDMATQTDCQDENGKITLIYTSKQVNYSDYQGGNGWNREHVWPKSLGGYNTSGAGADLHHIRPSDNRVNSTRGNKLYGNVNGGKPANGGSLVGSMAGGYYSGNYFEPLDNVKGDVARICLYMYARYGGDSRYTCSKITNVFQSVDVLLEWMELDPVDTWEMGRNEVVEAYQGNRNVFIDYPEYAWLLFGEEVPASLTTPSQGSGTGSTTPPTQAPTQAPTQKPTEAPTQAPTAAPTQKPTEASTQKPTEAPVQKPTEAPVQKPTEAPTEAPTAGTTTPPTAGATVPLTPGASTAPTTEATQPTTPQPTQPSEPDWTLEDLKEQIEALPDASQLTLAHKAEIQDILLAAKKYENANQLSQAHTATVTAAYEAVQKLVVDHICSQVNALPEPANITEANRAEIAAIVSDRDFLNDAYRAKLPAEVQQKLEAVQAALNAPSVTEPTTLPTVDPTQSPTAEAPSQEPAPSSSGTVIIVIAVILLVAGAAVLAVYLIRKKQDKQIN